MGVGAVCQARPVDERNVLGGPLEPCGTDPMTGFYRDGSCRCGTGGRRAARGLRGDDRRSSSSTSARSATTCRPPARSGGSRAAARGPVVRGRGALAAGVRRRRRRPGRARRHQRAGPRGRPVDAAGGARRRRPGDASSLAERRQTRTRISSPSRAPCWQPQVVAGPEHARVVVVRGQPVVEQSHGGVRRGDHLGAVRHLRVGPAAYPPPRPASDERRGGRERRPVEARDRGAAPPPPSRG